VPLVQARMQLRLQFVVQATVRHVQRSPVPQLGRVATDSLIQNEAPDLLVVKEKDEVLDSVLVQASAIGDDSRGRPNLLLVHERSLYQNLFISTKNILI